jgi:hypothetical protein
VWGELTENDLLNPAKFIGRSPEQVDEFVEEEVEPALASYKEHISSGPAAEINV